MAKYSFEFKKKVVLFYLNGEGGYNYLSKIYGIPSDTLRGAFKLKDILAVIGFPKATYMYWQKRFDRANPDKELEDKILEIREKNKDFGYRRMYAELRKQGFFVNKKKVQRIMQKYNLQVTSFTRKSRKYTSYKGKVGKIAPNRINRRFDTKIPHQKITTDTTEFKQDKNNQVDYIKYYVVYLVFII